MTLRAARSVTVGLLGALIGTVAVGCGNDSALLRETDAAGLKDTLAQVRSAVDDRNCAAARSRLAELRSDVVNLDGSVDRRLRQRLRQEIDGKLGPAVTDECDNSKTEAQPTTTEPAPTGPTEPTTPEPAPAPTTPEPTESTTTETAPPAPETETIPAPPVPEPTQTEPAPVDPSQDPGGFGEDGG